MYSIKYNNGADVEPTLYTIDIEKKTFSSVYSGLVLDFKGLNGWSFDVWKNCSFITGNNCELKYSLLSGRKICTLKKGFSFIDFKKLYKNIDKNWAILNSKNNNKFIRNVCEKILKGVY